MNRPAARVQISPLFLRQALFLSLALLLTLAAGQLYHAWQSAQIERQVYAAQLARLQAHHAAAQLLPAHTVQRSQPATVSTAEFAAPQAQQRWVF